MTPAESTGSVSATLSVDGQGFAEAVAAEAKAEVARDERGLFSAVVDGAAADGSTLTADQLRSAMEANRHTHDPHPAIAGAVVARHPIYIANSTPEVRAALAADFDFVSTEDVPADGSHINYEGMAA